MSFNKQLKVVFDMEFEAKRKFASGVFGSSLGSAFEVIFKLNVTKEEHEDLKLAGVLGMPLFRSSYKNLAGQPIAVRVEDLIKGHSIDIADAFTGEMLIEGFLEIAKGLPAIMEMGKRYHRREAVSYKLMPSDE